MKLKEQKDDSNQFLVILIGLVTRVACGQPPVVVTPEVTDQILANPGMGWQTFHRTRLQDKNLPSWIPSSRKPRRRWRPILITEWNYRQRGSSLLRTAKNSNSK